MIKTSIITTALILTMSGCYQVSISVNETYKADANLSVYPSSGESIEPFFGKRVKDPYGYKNMCRKYMRRAELKEFDEFDVRAFYTFCDRKMLCDNSSMKKSRFYSDHQFNKVYCKNDYIVWNLKERKDYKNDIKLINSIKEEIGEYDGVNQLDILMKAFKWLKKNFIYVSDEEQFPYAPNHVYDVWFVNADKFTYGDCEDWTAKMIWLLKDVAGLPTNILYMVGAFAYTGEGHELPNIKDTNGVLWQADNMLNAPMPAYYAYKSLGAKSASDLGMGEIMRMDIQGKWFKFKPENLKKPCEYKK